MTYTLGLDLGSSSIGWAAIDEDGGRFLGVGARVFPEGVDRDTSGAEHPKNERRRIARGHRRQLSRRSRRKRALRRALAEAGWWDGQTETLVNEDPYELRTKGLSEQLTLSELGRALMHINQRRGFLSNRKADRGSNNEKSEILQEINALAEAIEQSGSRTLGEYLHRCRETDGVEGPVRRQHTRRDMYEKEFELLWKSQQRFHPDVLTDELKFGRQGPQRYPRDPKPLKKRRDGNSLLKEFGFHGILFFQRSLYWPKSVVGRCELEPRERRCERADRRAQRFRLLNEVNNLQVIPQKGEPRPLTNNERESLIEYLSGRKEATFDLLRKRLGLLEGDGFNLEAGSRRKLHGVPIDAALAHKSLFGKSWYKRPDDERTEIVRSLLDDEDEPILQKAVDEWGCTPELAVRLSEVDLTSVVRGYASYGLTAIQKLLPHLEAGLPMMSKDNELSALAAAGYLRPDERIGSQGKSLPLPTDDITNPLVRQALFEVRKVVHAAIREWGMPRAIHIELAREVQGSPERRLKAAQAMRAREKERDDAAEKIRELGYKPSRDAINRYRLWKEQGEICLYSGQAISPRQLMEGEADIDHILPRWRSLDNSYMNKVVAFRRENEAKGNRTPYEWLAEIDPEKFDAILQRARSLPYEIRFRKILKLQAKEVVLEKFIARQLTDTAYITTQVLTLLRHLQGVDVVPIKGQLTSELRHQWGLNTVLRTDGLNLKNRDDHRHHAVDAIVIALTNRSRLQQLARVRGADEVLEHPWSNFRDVVEEAVDGIKVSHKSVRDISGALHEETIYGPTSKPDRALDGERPHAQGWIEDEEAFTYRKPLRDLTSAMVDDIRDPQVKTLVLERLEQFGVKRNTKGKLSAIPKDAFKEPLYMTRKAGRKGSRPTSVIKKVRLIKRDQTIKPIRGGSAWVKPGNTHHIAIFELPAKPGKKPKRVLHSVNMMEASRRARHGEPLISRIHPNHPDAKFIFSLSWGETVWATIQNREDLYVYRTSASTTGQMTFVSHTDARPSNELEKFRPRPNTLDGVKVTVDPLGRLRNAND